MIDQRDSTFMHAINTLTIPLTFRSTAVRYSPDRWLRVIFRYLSALVFLFPGLQLPALGIDMTDANHLFTIAHQFNAPSDVAVSADNRIYVVDGVNQKVKVFDSSGTFLSDFGRQGPGPGEFSYPLGIDIDRSGRIFIADTGNRRIQVLTSEGDFIAEIKIKVKGTHLPDPTDVVVDENRNRCYVVDNDNHRILVYDMTTRKLADIYGQPGTAKREFRYPFKITLDKNNYLHIVDVINTRVQVLNSDGLFVAIIGDWGVEKGRFFRPKGIAIDKAGRVYVSDSYIGVIQVFKANGEFHSVVGDRSTGAIRKFRTPTGLTIDHRNRLYVVEMFANQVSVYRLK